MVPSLAASARTWRFATLVNDDGTRKFPYVSLELAAHDNQQAAAQRNPAPSSRGWPLAASRLFEANDDWDVVAGDFDGIATEGARFVCEAAAVRITVGQSGLN